VRSRASTLESAFMSDLHRLRELMRRLRAREGGCPWDLEQTFSSLVPHTIEEVYEVADVIASGELRELPSELGDLLFQILFYSQLGEEQGRFSLDDVMTALEHKLVSRHPHVFGDAQVTDATAVAAAWEARKADERSARNAGAAVSELDDVPQSLPALSRARKLQKRAARVGFDWPDAAGPWAKVNEESAELAQAAAGGKRGDIEAELGDLLFAVVNLARHLDTDPEAALRAANRKFERRFRHIESAVAARGERLERCDLATLDALWDDAKRKGL
jgi:MazG family protein